MAHFEFRARDPHGRAQQGRLEAQSVALAANELRGRGFLILDLAPARGAATAPRRRAGRRFGVLPATSFDVEIGLRQLGMMTRSGLNLLQGLDAIADHARRAQMARVWRDVGAHVESGHSLVESLARHPRRFPPLIQEVVKAGEQSGSLDTAFERCAAHLERRRELFATVLQATFYPTIVLLLATAVSVYMVAAVIPVLEQFLVGMHRKLPGMTQALISVSHWLRLHLPTLMVAGGCTVLGLLALDQWPPARTAFDRFLYRVPLLGKVRRLAVTAMFARAFGTLLENGINVVHALELCEGIMRRPVAKARIASTRRAVLDGRSLAEGLGSAWPFMPLTVNMIALGERSGELDSMLDNVAKFYESELRTWIRRASIFLEPVITIVVGVIVGFVYISFFLAMFAIM